MAKLARYRWQGTHREPRPAPIITRKMAPSQQRATPRGSKHRPPTDRQLRYLSALAGQLGIERPAVRTSRQASDAIDALRAKREGRR